MHRPFVFFPFAPLSYSLPFSSLLPLPSSCSPPNPPFLYSNNSPGPSSGIGQLGQGQTKRKEKWPGSSISTFTRPYFLPSLPLFKVIKWREEVIKSFISSKSESSWSLYSSLTVIFLCAWALNCKGETNNEKGGAPFLFRIGTTFIEPRGAIEKGRVYTQVKRDMSSLCPPRLFPPLKPIGN
ncbi:hypothetical protein F5H01DRAFT_347323 [Linnemannia elongata]|nr:hypothetical protein F5H01DRAFT_347323 [Linnemannia elongata]